MGKDLRTPVGGVGGLPYSLKRGNKGLQIGGGSILPIFDFDDALGLNSRGLLLISSSRLPLFLACFAVAMGQGLPASWTGCQLLCQQSDIGATR
ncbi:hypothetical protein ES703_57271 [subsurface metagenome]